MESTLNPLNFINAPCFLRKVSYSQELHKEVRDKSMKHIQLTLISFRNKNDYIYMEPWDKGKHRKPQVF
jgi:hypothetical protein